MGLAQPNTTLSYLHDNTPLGLSYIFNEEVSVAIWKRVRQQKLVNYFEQSFCSLGMGLRQVCELETLREELQQQLPNNEGKDAVIDDIYLLSDMLTCLFNCKSVGLRLVPLEKAMCPKFHTDNIPVRLVCTYLGDGTQWLPSEAISQTPSSNQSDKWQKTSSGLFFTADSIQQLGNQDVGLLKGSAWNDTGSTGAIHRSCPVEHGDKRVLLTLDPM